MVAHDLRAPVAVLRGTAEMLVGDYERLDDDHRLRLLSMLLATSGRLSALVDDVLDMASIESGQLRFDIRALDLVDIVRRAAADVDPAHERIHLDARAGSIAVSGDERRVWQVVTNLLTNALKFSPAAEPVHVVIEIDGGAARVSVTDRGHGVPADAAGSLFEPFGRAPAATGAAGQAGTGLGLYIARSLVTAQGGDITVNSAPGAGSTFSFTLPLAH